MLLAASPRAPAKTSVVSAWRCDRSEKERSPGPGTLQERLRNEAGESRLVTGELELAGQRGRARVRVLGTRENLDLRGHMGPVMKLAQATEPSRGIRKDSGLADDMRGPCQPCWERPARLLQLAFKKSGGSPLRQSHAYVALQW